MMKKRDMKNQIEVIGSLEGNNEIYARDRGRVLDGDGICVSLIASEYKDPTKILENHKSDTDMNKLNKYGVGGVYTEASKDFQHGPLNDISRTLKANVNDAGVIERNMNTSNTEYRIRKLTAKECWRLMGFSDEDYEVAEKVNSKTQLYKQAGNAIVENVLVAIFGQMIPGCEDVYKDRREVKNEQSSINT